VTYGSFEFDDVILKIDDILRGAWRLAVTLSHNQSPETHTVM